jgi:AcrR family transcriptional regulator
VAERRRNRRPSLSNDEFLEKAFDIFTASGFDGTTIDALSSEAGIAKRTIYQRYGDKKGVFIAAMKHAIDEWIIPTERLEAAETPDLETTLQAIGKILVDNLLSPAGMRLLRLTNAESGRMPEIGEHNVHHGQDRTMAYLADLFRRHLGGEDMPFRDAEDAAETFLHLVVGGPANSAAWGIHRTRSAIDSRIRYSVGLFLHGLKQRQAGDADGPAPAQLKAENERLKKLLAETMIELDKARDAAGGEAS